MKHPLYVVEQGAKLSIQGRRLQVYKDDDLLTQAAVLQISQVILFGNIQVTTPAMRLLCNADIDVVLLSRRGRYYGRLSGVVSGNSPLRVAQIVRSQNQPQALDIARSVVRGKLHNMRVFLLRYARRGGGEPVASAADSIRVMFERIDAAPNTATLMGIEGKATAAYFSVWRHLLKTPWTFGKRVRRPPTDPVNALISFAYTLLLQNVQGAIMTTGLDPYVGFLHQLEYNRPSLALDLVEEFRPIVADSLALRCLNNEILREEHFRTGDSERPVLLTDDGVRLFIREFERRMEQKFKHPRTGAQVSYRRLLLLQAYEIARILKPNADPPHYQPFLVR